MSAPGPEAPGTGKAAPPKRRRRLAGHGQVGIAATLATLVVWNLLVELLGGAVSSSLMGEWLQGPLTVIGYVIVPAALLFLLARQSMRLWRARAFRRDPEARQPESDSGSEITARAGHLAQQGSHWAGGLSGDAAPEAVSWFRATEEELRELLVTQAQAEGPLADGLVDDLAAVATALEAWYLHRQQPEELARVNENLRQIVDWVDNRPDLKQIVSLRTAKVHRLRGDLGAARAELGNAQEIAGRIPAQSHTASLDARSHNEWGLIHFAAAQRHTDRKAAADELENASRVLESGWGHLPRADISGEMTMLINLAAAGLHREQVELQARSDSSVADRLPSGLNHRRLAMIPDHLGRAEALAREERDLVGLAHVIELRGVAAWLDEKYRLAVEHWRDALNRYAEVGFEEGTARCLQHLGSAIVVVPEVAGLLRDNEWVILDARGVQDEARWRLERSRELRDRSSHAGIEFVEHYLALVEETGRASPLRRRTDSLGIAVRRVASRVRRRGRLP